MRNPLSVKGAILLAIMTGFFSVGKLAIASDNPAPRILVSGEGSVEVAPDMAVLVLSVMREAPTARAALTENSTAMSKVLQAMGGLGIAKRDLQTSNFAIEPRYSYPPPRQAGGDSEAPKLEGYTVRNTLTVRVRDISRIGEVLDTSVTLGVNEGGSILFTNDDASAAITQARVKAMDNALDKARTLANAAGVKVGTVLEISEQFSNPQPMPMARASMAMASDAERAPIATGENAYSVTVNLSLAIEQ